MSFDEEKLNKDIFKRLFDINYEQILNSLNDEYKNSKNLILNSNILIGEVYNHIKDDYIKIFKNTLKQFDISNKQYDEINDTIFNQINKEMNSKIKEIIKLEILKKINMNESNDLEDNNIKNKNEKVSKDNNKNKEYPISLGIKLGAQYTCYSISTKINGLFQTNVLLSNASKRVIPSQICYSDTHRLYGDNANSLIKKFYYSSYCNLSRLIGFDYNLTIFQNEITDFFDFGTYDDITNNFNCNNDDIKNFNTENIIADFLSLINEYYFEKENNKYDFTTICVPDYFLINQRQILKLICEAIGMKNIKVINESSAITMYYGYNKYRDIFVTNKDKVNSGIKKHVIFIDIGYSKTQIIYSIFKYNEFIVKDVESYPLIGGRNFNKLIFNELKNKFSEKYEIEEKITQKNIIRLIEEIEKKRKQLSINKDATIIIESFYKGNDFEYVISKEEFEKIVSNEISKIKKYLEDFKNKHFKKVFPENFEIEIAGELMRTPILQNLIEEIFKIKVSKTILIDECSSVGSSLFRHYLNNELLINTFNTFYSYNNYKIECNINKINKQFVIKDYNSDISNENYFGIDIKDIISFNGITLFYFYSMKHFQQCQLKSIYLYKYKINLKLLKKNNKTIKNYKQIVFVHKFLNEYYFGVKIIFLDGEIQLKNGKSNIQGKIYNCEYDDCIKINNNIDINSEKFKEIKINILKSVECNKKKDEIYFNYSNKRNELSKLIYSLKNKLSNLDSEQSIKDEVNYFIKTNEKKIKEIEKEKDLLKKINIMDEIKKEIEGYIQNKNL